LVKKNQKQSKLLQNSPITLSKADIQIRLNLSPRKSLRKLFKSLRQSLPELNRKLKRNEGTKESLNII
jgi:hypothetical protein